jgi:excinuclease ABC subunit B
MWSSASTCCARGWTCPKSRWSPCSTPTRKGFLRSGSALIQTIGRAARHVEGKAILYADVMTDSMRFAIDETNRRRTIQEAYNREHNIEPQSIVKGIRDLTDRVRVIAESKPTYTVADGGAGERVVLDTDPEHLSPEDLNKLIKSIEQEMKTAAKALEFERAAALRDQLVELRRIEVERKVAA